MNCLRSLFVAVCLCTFILTCRCTVDVSTKTSASCNSTLICETNGKKDKKVLYVLAMGPYPTEIEKYAPSWPGGPAVIPGLLLAIKHINCDPNILPDYRLDVILSDGGCQWKTRAFTNFTSNIYLNQSLTSDNVVGVVGGGCSESALVVAKHVTRDPLSLVQISPSATSPVFVTEMDDYKNTIRLAPSALSFVRVFTRIVMHNNYSEVAILYDFQRRYMIEVARVFQEALKKEDVNVTMDHPILEGFVSDELKKLRGHNRLIFVFAGRALADEVLCVAFVEKMLYPDYQFIFINRRACNFLKAINVTDPNNGKVIARCTKEDMKQAILSATIFEPRLTRADQNTTTVSGYTYEQINCQYLEVLENHKNFRQLEDDDLIDTEYQNAYYDSTWALAKSLHNAQSEVDLSTYKYGQPENTKAILNQFFNLTFEGAVGKIRFTRDTFDTQNVSIVNIYQQRFNETSSEVDSLVVAFYNSESENVSFTPNAKFVNSSVFEDLVIIHPPLALGWAVVAVTIIMFVVIGLLHCINWMFADMKNLKATSPHLNNIIFSGCYLLLLGVLTYSLLSVFLIETSSPNPPDRVWFSVMCNVQLWVATYALSLIFGTICMKTWRIWRIFTHFSSVPLRFAGDGILVGFVVFLIAIDTVYLTIWISVSPLELSLEGPENTKVAVCGSRSPDDTLIWALLLICYKVLVIGCVLFLSVKTRKISKKEFKQTKSINTLIYILLFNFTLGIAPYAIVTESGILNYGSMIAAYVLYCFTYILATIFCIIFVFLPPIYPIIRKKLRYYYYS